VGRLKLVECHRPRPRKDTVSDIYTTDHNRLPSVDCDAFGLTADVSGIKVWVIPLQIGARLVQLERRGIGSTSCGEGDGAHSGSICSGASSFSDETPSSTVSSRGLVERIGGSPTSIVIRLVCPIPSLNVMSQDSNTLLECL
jgi:hypothetical protein